MKNLANYLYVIPVITLLISCCGDSPPSCLQVSSNIISETRTLKDFKSVNLTGNGIIYLTQGPGYSVLIKGPDNVVELTTTKIENKMLEIGSDACFNGEYTFTVEITAPEYWSVNITGAGKIKTVGQIEGDVLEMELTGGGDIEADVNVDSLYTTISGHSTVNYTGNVIRHELSCSGEFRVDSYSLGTDYTFVDLIGIGDCYVYADKTLSVNIEGTGDVYYQGKPTIQTNITGSGKVIDSN